jgi:prepilin-type N-terminal cleavage/methylation domain-containing protein
MLSIRDRRSSTGFTLVELLVVIAIIGILVALLLPAIQAAREAARRAQCQNNVKNLALALHNYHDAHKTFPPAVKAHDGNDKPGIDRTLYANWAILILPYIEEQPLYDSFQLVYPARVSDGIATNDGNWDERGTDLKVMLCPSDTGGGVHFQGSSTTYGSGGAMQSNGNWARTNYAYNGFQFWPDSWHQTTPAGAPYWDDLNSGVGGIDTSNSVAQITDGTSHTIMIGEIRVGLDEHDRRGVWAMGMCGSSFLCRQADNGPGSGPNAPCQVNDDDLLFDGPAKLQINGQLQTENMCFSYNQASGQSMMRSTHPGGVFVAMADASVRFISDNVESGDQGYAGQLGAKIGAFDGDPNAREDKFGVWQRLNVARDGFSVGSDSL